jgi:hypothetical protein
VYELVSEIDINAPVAAVRAILTDFDSYSKWTGAARVIEEPDDPTRITYAIRVIFKGSPERPWTFPGRLTTNHPDLLGWRLGMLGLLVIEMQYAFAWTNGATHVRHLVRFRGVLPALSKNRFKRIFQPVMDRTLSDLAMRARQPSRPLRTSPRVRPGTR